MAVNQESAGRRNGAIRCFVDGVGTFAALLLAFAAFDDITTDNATTFRTEYTLLVGCAAWLALVAIRLLRTRHMVLGGISVVALSSAVWAQRAIGPGITPGFWPEYIVATASYLWFAALAFVLIWRGWREHRTESG
jgi:hypothetical protein